MIGNNFFLFLSRTGYAAKRMKRTAILRALNAICAVEFLTLLFIREYIRMRQQDFPMSAFRQNHEMDSKTVSRRMSAWVGCSNEHPTALVEIFLFRIPAIPVVAIWEYANHKK